MKNLPSICPACQSQLKIKELLCEKCSTEIGGLFELPSLAKLSGEDQEFVVQFVKCSGSLKEMARLEKLSYPTVRNHLDNIIEQIKPVENQE